MFTDQATIRVKAGNGGNGLRSFRREKFVEKGGPDGGDGGRGGNVIARVKDSIHGLSDYRHIKEIKADSGQAGGKRKRHGKSAADTIIFVPKGTVIKDRDFIIADLTTDVDEVVLARGGDGGYGNAHFKSSTRQAPKIAERGEPGEQKELTLELKLIADVGLVGLPNAGKSTFLSVVTNAKPKIANYPFTTLQPNLGIADVHGDSLIIADIPGLIAGASSGKGLGIEFLRHVERTAVLLHLIDITDEKFLENYQTIQSELSEYEVDLSDRQQVLVATKVDVLEAKDVKARTKQLKKISGRDVEVISSQTHAGLTELLGKLAKQVREYRSQPDQEESDSNDELPVIELSEEERAQGWQVEKIKDVYHVRGQKIEHFARRLDLSDYYSQLRIKDIMNKIGIMQELQGQGIEPGDRVQIGDQQFTV